VDKHGLWVHSLCYLWIPEIFTVEIKKNNIVSLSTLDKKRFKLKCALCSTKGACIQCHYGRCATAAHPWCVFHRPQGFTRRIVKDENGQLVWEIFCKAHAFAVSDPVKPKAKAKGQMSDAHVSASDDVDDETFYSAKNATRKSEPSQKHRSREYKDSRQQLSMAHSMKFSTSLPSRMSSKVQKSYSEDLEDDDDSVDFLQKSNRKKSRVVMDDDDDDDIEDFKLYKPLKSVSLSGKTSVAGSGSKPSSATVDAEPGEPSEELSFPIFTLSEWPGQAEGEVLDMDHFWNVVSMMHAEDHSPEVHEEHNSDVRVADVLVVSQWVEFMVAPLPQGSQLPKLLKQPCLCLPCGLNNGVLVTAEVRRIVCILAVIHVELYSSQLSWKRKLPQPVLIKIAWHSLISKSVAKPFSQSLVEFMS
jgi:hypothetical protein